MPVAWEPRQQSQTSTVDETDQFEIVDQDLVDLIRKGGVTLIGRPEAGKSMLLGSLMRQGGDSLHSFAHIKPHFTPGAVHHGQQASIDELIGLMHRFVQGSAFPATYKHKVLNYYVSLVCDDETPVPRSRWSWRSTPPIKRSAEIVITDAAGGIIMGETIGNQDRDEQLIASGFAEIVRASRGIVFCLPADTTGLALDAEYKQTQVIDSLVRNESIDLQRIVVCLTKYEALFADFGCEAMDKALDVEEFKQIARGKLQGRLLNSLIRLARSGRAGHGNNKVEVCVAPASAYGFVRHNGGVNFNPRTGRLLVESGRALPAHPRSSVPLPYYADDHALRYWQPFFVVDPFVYAAFGDKGRLTVDVTELE